MKRQRPRGSAQLLSLQQNMNKLLIAGAFFCRLTTHARKVREIDHGGWILCRVWIGAREQEKSSLGSPVPCVWLSKRP